MEKDPAFLFYAADFLTGTQFFTDEQVGKYIRLICAQKLHGHLPLKHMLIICGRQDEDIFEKYTIDENGFYYNEVLEMHIQKRAAYSASRANNRRGGTKPVDNKVFKDKNKVERKPKKDKNISNTYVPHMENVNVNVNVIENEVESEVEIVINEAENFKNDVWFYLGEYKETELNKFYNYWSEVFVQGKNKGKMRWQAEATWELGKRLTRFREGGNDKTGSVGPGSNKPVTSKIEVSEQRHNDILKDYE